MFFFWPFDEIGRISRIGVNWGLIYDFFTCKLRSACHSPCRRISSTGACLRKADGLEDRVNQPHFCSDLQATSRLYCCDKKRWRNWKQKNDGLVSGRFFGPINKYLIRGINSLSKNLEGGSWLKTKWTFFF